MRRTCLVAVLMAVAHSPTTLHARQLAVIAHPANSISNLSAERLIKIFNARTPSWPDGKPVTIVVKDPSSEDMKLILRKLFNMTAEQVRTFIQAHRGAIVVAASDDAVLNLVSARSEALGVVDLYSLTNDVHVVKIDGKLPVEQGYFLRGN